VLAEEVVRHRIGMLTHIICLLLKTVPEQRGALLREESPEYTCDFASDDPDDAIALSEFDFSKDAPTP
jgi:hypothetical protein